MKMQKKWDRFKSSVNMNVWKEMCEAAVLYGYHPTMLNHGITLMLANMPRVFPNVPSQPGMPCQGEDRSIYRRGARRWRKLYRVNGHIFQAKRFNRRAFCAFCHDRIWGLGRQGFKCIQCKLLVHKKCHKLVQIPCTNEHIEPIIKEDHNGETQAVGIARSELISELRDFPEPPPDLEQKQVPPPYKPRLDGDRDLANFPPEFTDEPVHLTPDDPRVIEKIDQSEFEGFEYVNPLLMSLEDCV
ncbi:hypothetical protein PPYR_01084 [Photinus pyralis]|uniref:Phorbol-ester/DAG-type domain-containing protein n=1 Tax=Photinus pyralis TaxID=7054 RepID=A0A5N4B3I0_PHOPY|nr:hypothetical protein PPYR_01084 [Photinus pyralis]